MVERVERSTTVFVDNLPLQLRKIWVYNLFSKFGVIKNIFIPNKRSKITGQNFAFVRFVRLEDAEASISNTNNSWHWGQKLVVKFARFLKKDDTSDPQMSSLRNHTIQGRSSNFKSYQWNQWKQDPQIHHSSLHKEKRGKEVWRKKGTTESSKQGEQRAKVIEAPAEVHLGRIRVQAAGYGWLSRSAIAKISRLVSTKDLEHVFIRERDIKVQIKAIGGRFVIITFADMESRDLIIKERWLTQWFEEIKPWRGEQAMEERFVWLSCYGMPLNAWSNTTFKEIGNKWGQFLQVDEATLKESSYVQAKILIATNQFHKVEGYIDLIIDEALYPVRVMEDDSFRTISSSFFDISSVVKEKHAPVEDVDKSMKQDEMVKPADEESKYGAHIGLNTDEEATSNSIAGVPLSINEAAIVRDSMNSSLGNEKSFMENEKVSDSFGEFSKKTQPQPNINHCLIHQESDMLVADVSEEDILNVIDNRIGELFLEEHVGNNADVVNEVTAEINEQNKATDAILEENIVVVDDLLNEDCNQLVVSEKEANQDSLIQAPIQSTVKGLQGKKKRKNINDILGYTKVNPGMGGGRNKNKFVVLRSTIAAAALTASISSGGINNRNRILLDEAQAIWAINKMHGINYDGDEQEVVSKIADLEAKVKEKAVCHL